MCGITGGIGRSHPSKEIMDVQLSLLSHRGPDSVGTFIDSGISLGMCRLAIVEIEHGTQPATDRNRKVHIIWNGEIYNFKELGHELSQYGIILQNSSESEVLLQLYLKYGLDFINRVNGMFAIAIFDSRDYSLHLVRDRMGKKPLWITQLTDNTLFFASEIKALLKVQSNLTIRPQMISEILQYGYIKAPNSPFEKIFQLPPASITSWREGNTTSMIYWTPSFIPKNHISYEFAVKKTGELVKKAVERRLLSERPLGSFLSGGIDSTIVTAYMSQLTHEKINTFSIGFEDENLNEANYASDISKYLGANHHVAILREDIGKLTEEIFSKVDLPFADSSIIPTYFLSKFAKSELVVALTGDGGDEIFGGYTRYYAAQVLQRFNPLLGLMNIGIKAPLTQILMKKKHFLRFSAQLKSMSSLANRYFSIQSLVQQDEINNLINPQLKNNESFEKFILDFNRSPNISNLDKIIRSDLDYYLPGDILTKIDLASMFNSLELRSPFLDVDVVEWGILLPNKYRVSGFKSKRVLKDLAYSLVPKDLVNRPKMGFGVPRAKWLRSDLRELVLDTLGSSKFKQRGWFNISEIRKLTSQHMDGINKDNQIWPILCLELWAKSWLDSR